MPLPPVIVTAAYYHALRYISRYLCSPADMVDSSSSIQGLSISIASPDSRPGPTDDEYSRPQSMPLLHRRNDHNRFQDHGDDLERPSNELNEDASRQSSFDLNDALFEQVPLQSSGSSWTPKLQNYLSLFSRSAKGWRSRPKSSTKTRPRSFRMIFYFIAIIFMMLSVPPPPPPYFLLHLRSG